MKYERVQSQVQLDHIGGTGPDHIGEIWEKMREIMSMTINGPNDFFCPNPEKPEYLELIDHQITELPDEYYEWREELCQICNEYKLPEGHHLKKVKRGSSIHCQTKSLCATVLWEKIKSEFPDETLVEFAKRVNITKPTINNTRKKMRQIDLR